MTGGRLREIRADSDDSVGQDVGLAERDTPDLFTVRLRRRAPAHALIENRVKAVSAVAG
jgi:hypothetical protein